MADFDKVARQYDEIHNRNIALSGEDSCYFTRQKLGLVAAHLARSGDAGEALLFLDVGCGTGKFEAMLSEAFPRASSVSVDPSLESLKVASPRAGKGHWFVCAQGESMPLAAAVADVALCSCVLHHMEPQRRAAMLAEVARVLKPGGVLFVFEHNPLNPLTRHVVRTCEFDEGAVLLRSGAAAGESVGAGLRLVRRRYTVFFPHFLRWLRFLEPRLGWLPLGAQYVVVCRKP